MLLVMAGLAALDFLVPIENGFKPNLAKAQRVFRFVGEGGAAYHPAKSICKAELSKDKARRQPSPSPLTTHHSPLTTHHSPLT